jgi:hypothetical protein
LRVQTVLTEVFESESWFRVDLGDILRLVDRLHPNVMAAASAFTLSELRKPGYSSMVSGTVFRSHRLLPRGEHLAVNLFFDFVSTAMNTRGRSGVTSRNWGVLMLSFANVPAFMYSKRYIFPIAIISKPAFAAVGYDRFVRPVLEQLSRLETGARNAIARAWVCLTYQIEWPDERVYSGHCRTRWLHPQGVFPLPPG